MKKFLSVVCLTVALSAQAFPASARIPWRILGPFLRGLGTVVGRELIDAIQRPQNNTFAAYTDGEWLITIEDIGDDLIYYGVNLDTENDIALSNVTYGGNSQRRLFSWNNGNYRYQVAYRPNDPGVVRLQVFEGSQELLNTLLYRYQPDD